MSAVALRLAGARALAASLGLVAAIAAAEPALVDAMRGPVPILDATTPPRMGNAVNDDHRLPRNFAQQPPIIPHRVDGYQIDKNFNKCLDCHARAKTAFSLAVPVSVTHYINREGKVLEQISTRRYFCMQCHVAQEAVNSLVGNSFRNVDAVGRKAGEASRAKQK